MAPEADKERTSRKKAKSFRILWKARKCSLTHLGNAFVRSDDNTNGACYQPHGKVGGSVRVYACVALAQTCTHHTQPCVCTHAYTHPLYPRSPGISDRDQNYSKVRSLLPSCLKKRCSSWLLRKHLVFLTPFPLGAAVPFRPPRSKTQRLRKRASCTGWKGTAAAQLVRSALESCICDIRKRRKRHDLGILPLFAVWFPKCRPTPKSPLRFLLSAPIVSSLELPLERGRSDRGVPGVMARTLGGDV